MSRKREGPGQLSLFGAGESGPALAPAAAATAPIAERLPEGLRLGASSWTFPGWQGLVWNEPLSEARLAREGLAIYGRHPLFRTVGIDRTFYAPVEASLFRTWAEQVPSDFRFLVKAHEGCTLARWPDHARYGKRRGTQNELFLDVAWATDRVVAPAVEGLGEKAGPILFQVPPQPLAALGGAEGFAERLHRFLAALPKGPLYAVEVRNGPLLCPAYLQALADTGTVHCLNVQAGMVPIEAQLRRFNPMQARAVVVRWMLHAGLRYEQAVDRYRPFSALVNPNPGTRETIARLAIAATARKLPVWVIVNNKAEGSSPLSIELLARRIAELLTPGGADPGGGRR